MFLLCLKNQKILRAVISFIAVDMMYNLSALKRPAYSLFGHYPMFMPPILL